MPGFNIGTGQAEGRPNATTEIRRKHRWTFALADVGIDDIQTGVLFLKKAARPNVQFEEAVLDHDQERAYYAGRTEWDPIELVWYDAEQSPNVSNMVYQWIQKISDIAQATVAIPSEYKKICNVRQHDGKGTIKEDWTLFNAWPQRSNWNDLDYTSNDLQEITINLRYDRATVEYKN
jgi:hypothetical protein